MAKGKFYDNIEKDPRDTVGADDKIDLKSLPQYQGLSTQKTMLPDKDVTVKQASKKVDKWVDKMLDLARAAKKRVADRKEAAAAPEKPQETPKEAPKETPKEAVKETPAQTIKEVAEQAAGETDKKPVV